jgi:hypothetical protein
VQSLPERAGGFGGPPARAARAYRFRTYDHGLEQTSFDVLWAALSTAGSPSSSSAAPSACSSGQVPGVSRGLETWEQDAARGLSKVDHRESGFETTVGSGAHHDRRSKEGTR